MNDEQASADTIQFPVSVSNAPTQPGRHVIPVHYFAPFQGKLLRIENDLMENCWTGKQPLTVTNGNLRIMSVVFDETAGIACCHFMAVRMVDGKISKNSIEEVNDVTVRQALETTHNTGQILPDYIEQTAHWPDNWRALVARELSIAPNSVHEVGVGGPLLTAFTTRYSLNKAVRIHAVALRLKLGIQPIVIRKPRSDYRGVVEFSFSSELKPWDYDPSEYLLEVTGHVKATFDTEDYGDPQPAGELKLLIIKMAEARKARVQICGICDCHSSDMEEVWSTLFADDELKEEFDLQSPSGDLLYLDEIALLPEYEDSPLYFQVIETAIASFASRGLVVAYRTAFNDDAKRWRKLSFKEIPRSELLVRQNHVRCGSSPRRLQR